MVSSALTCRVIIPPCATKDIMEQRHIAIVPAFSQLLFSFRFHNMGLHIDSGARTKELSPIAARFWPILASGKSRGEEI